MTIVYEYDRGARWIIGTDVLGPDEYGASMIVARDVEPSFADLAIAALAATPAPLDVEGVRLWLIERGYISTANVLAAVIDAEQIAAAPGPPKGPDTTRASR